MSEGTDKGGGDGVEVDTTGARVFTLDEIRERSVSGGYRVAEAVCPRCRKEVVTCGPMGSVFPDCPVCHVKMLRKVERTVIGRDDPTIRARQELVAALEQLLAEVASGHVDAAFIAARRTTAHPEGESWANLYSTNVGDYPYRLGILAMLQSSMAPINNGGKKK